MDNYVEEFKVIDISMLDKRWFLPLSSLGSYTAHTILYPFTLVRTRLQLQEGRAVYRGLIHATRCIIREEGWRGLYSGFLVKSTQLVSGMLYTATYETMRYQLSNLNLSSRQASFIAGGCASIVGQTVTVPVDVISQHLMVLSQKSTRIRHLTPLKLTTEEMATPLVRMRSTIRHLYQRHGIRGLYHGYLISLSTFVPNSALWWAFYNEYCDVLSANLPVLNGYSVPRLMIQVIAAPLAGMTSATIMNPVDCIRVRMQVENTTLRPTVLQLWYTEGVRFLIKGLTARLAQASIFSFSIILFYEPVKLFCLKEEYRDHYSL